MKALLILIGSFATGLMMKSETSGFMVRAVMAAEPSPKAAKKKGETEKKAEAATIEGMEVSRGAAGFLGVQIVGTTFKISFYDAKRKPIAADVPRAVLRWDPKYKVGSERLLLTRTEDGMALTSSRNVRPPYLFKLFITLLPNAADGEAADGAGETHVIDFRG
ncbi:MAG: hypothetical protein JNK23_18130 [Opitutaceae bacterium]|nr:hypothetical protein [Opitutaceae bacterium]